MSIDMNAYSDCLGCDGLVFLNDTGSFLTVSPKSGGGHLHTSCRAQYEKENGAVVCEDDEEDALVAEELRACDLPRRV